MSLKSFLPFFTELYKFGLTAFDYLFNRTVGEVLQDIVQPGEHGMEAELWETLYEMLEGAFPWVVNMSPILFLFTSGISLIILIHCIKFIVGIFT